MMICWILIVQEKFNNNNYKFYFIFWMGHLAFVLANNKPGV